jgi:ABC-type nitrate/sulfonate/bicarbonate transport system substrate-binding protein
MIRNMSVAAVTVCLAALFMSAGCAPARPAQLERTTIAVFDWPGSEAVYVAYEKGYFRDEGLDVVLQPYLSGAVALDAALAGKADFATVADTPVVSAVIRGKPATIMATICSNDRAFMIVARKDAGISSVVDLRGKRVGMTAGTANEFFLFTYLVTSHIDPKDVKITDMSVDRGLEALLNGGLEAMSMSLPSSAVARNKLGNNAVVLSAPGIYAMTFNIAASQEFATSNPERIRKLLRAIIRANAAIDSGAVDPGSVSAKYIGVDSALYEREWSDFHCSVTLNQGLLLNLEDQARWMLKAAGGGGPMPNFLDHIYTKALAELHPDAVTIRGR